MASAIGTPSAPAARGEKICGGPDCGRGGGDISRSVPIDVGGGRGIRFTSCWSVRSVEEGADRPLSSGEEEEKVLAVGSGREVHKR